MNNLLDCLVLCIDDLSTFKLFVLYDTKKKVYELRGKNHDLKSGNVDSVIVSDSESDSESSYCDSDSEEEEESKEKTDFVPFSFKCKKRKHLIDFMEYIVSTNSCEFTIYNYNNFPCNSNKITYEFLENHQQSRNEIFCYEKESFDKVFSNKMLKMIKNIYNNY
jgi:hypothetical protein